MPATGRVTSASALDSSAMMMRPKFAQASGTGGSSGITGLHWKCTKLVLQAGIAPSYALCEIPLAALDDTAPAIAGVSSSPLEGIKIGTPCEIEGITASGETVQLLVGYVASITPRFGPREDTGIVEVLDARWILEGVPIVGSFWKGDGENTGTNGICYRQGWPAHFNAGGQPNCIFVGSVPVFCEPNYGIGDNESPADPSTDTARETKACHWTSQAALQYLRFAALESTHATYLVTKFPWLAYVKNGLIVWPEGWSSAISSGESRKMREFEVKGENILQLIEHVLKGEGAYDLYLGPDVGSSADAATAYKAQLQVIRTRYYQGDKTIPRAMGLAIDTMTDANAVTQGSLKLDGRNLFTRFAGAGGLVFVEQRVNGPNANNDQPIKRAWSASDQTDAEAIIVTNMNAGHSQEEALEKAFSHYPNVCAAYRLNETYNYQTSTSESAYPRAKIGRPVLGELLSSYLEKADGSGVYDKLRFRRPVLFEYNDGTNWHLALKGDAMRRYADGTFTLEALRDAGQTYKLELTYLGSTVTGATLTARQLRVSLGIPCDHRLTAAFRLASDESTNVDVVAPEQEDADKIDKGFSRLNYTEADLYGRELRRGEGDSQGSYPVPEIAGGSIAENKDGEGDNGMLRNDLSLLEAHVKKKADNAGRISRGGTLVIPHITYVWQPGLSLHAMKNSTAGGGDYPIRAMIWQVTIEADSKVNRTTLSLR